ncbi:Peptidase family S41 [Solimonas aquatica]|uniref:Peptidase family S41 n=1 Tax=Solimonas aquatica TaxID=489703 RepID=A0A1H9DLA6_9GAMM|nr:S41 family peptidase [Solimonas aquatica]SEQ13498.1 Peptidase family S41 [Solimonas aquatica]
MLRLKTAVGCLACLLAGLLSSCGGGGGGAQLASDKLAQICMAPRSGVDPYTGKRYTDRAGTLGSEQRWLDAYMHEIYLWYPEIPGVNASAYSLAAYGSVYDAMAAYFKALRTPAITSSGKRKDPFSFVYPTDEWNAQSSEGLSVGYGMQIRLVANRPPRQAVVVAVDAGTSADAQGIARGAQILAIDGVDMVNDGTQAGVDTLNAGLFPASAGEQHRFNIQDFGSSGTRELVLTAQSFTERPVPLVKTLETASGKVGYILFNDHIATAEGALYEAVQQLSAAGIQDLVLDLRYNGGGYLDIASELAYMIAGASATQNKVFERLSFNDKNPRAAGDAATPFHATAQGFDASLPEGTALPQLNLQRLYVLLTGDTCSASEAVINSLRGVDVDVVLIGETSCGKPYGFYAQDNCGISYFAIEFSGTNAKGFGDYADGFTPTCAVDDDYSHEPGDAGEGMLAAALSYRQSGVCPGNAKRASLSGGRLLRSPVKENAWRRR